MAAAFSLGGSLLAEAEDVLEAVLQEVDAAALRQLKATSVHLPATGLQFRQQLRGEG